MNKMVSEAFYNLLSLSYALCLNHGIIAILKPRVFVGAFCFFVFSSSLAIAVFFFSRGFFFDCLQFFLVQRSTTEYFSQLLAILPCLEIYDRILLVIANLAISIVLYLSTLFQNQFVHL